MDTQSFVDAGIWVDDDHWVERGIPRRPWVAYGYLMRGAVTLVVGPPSTMKSSLMLGWAAAMALGKAYGKFRPSHPGRTIIYNVEDDANEQRRRLSAVLRQFDAVPADIQGKIMRTGPERIGTLFARDEVTGLIMPTMAMAALKARLGNPDGPDAPAVLIVDPLTELHTADENDNTAVRAIIAEFRQLAKEHKIAVVLVHHTRKGASASPGDPDIARGASAIIGAVRVALTLCPMSEDDAKGLGLPIDRKSRGNYIRLDDGKQNYAAIDDAVWFEKALYELDNGEVVPAAVPWIPPAQKVASLDDLLTLASAIAQGCDSGEPWSPKLSNEARSIKPLLEKLGFNGKDAQSTALKRLAQEMDMQTADFKKTNRGIAKGLRISSQPVAEWVDT